MSHATGRVLSILLVIQRSSSEAEVVFQHPPPTEPLETGNSTSGDMMHADARLSWKVFGIDSRYFAKLMLPHQQLCNWAFELTIDSGRMVSIIVVHGALCE